MKKRKTAVRVGRLIGHAVDSTVNSAAGRVSHAFTSGLRLAGLRSSRHAAPVGSRTPDRPGTVSGIEAFDVDTPPPPGTIHYTVIDFGPDLLTHDRPHDLDTLLDTSPPEGAAVRWINVDGLHPHVVKRFLDAYGFHTLAAEDTLNAPQRPKAEPYDDHLFVVARMMQLDGDDLHGEQVSFFLKPGLLLTFQERPGDLWQPIRERLEKHGSRIRTRGADYLMYALLDATVDHCFPILERFGDVLEDLEPRIIDDPDPALIREVYQVKRELTILRRVLWPTRELLATLLDEATAEITPEVKLFLRDVQEHCVQLVEIIETFREMTNSLTDLHMSAVSNRMNEVMKFLTILGSLFIPITFLAGIYGMNFDHIPELHKDWGYPAFWVACGLITVGLLIYFRKKGWLGN